jgi:hypothetical protein
MSEVYKAHDGNGQAVAIKVLKALSQHLMERFSREISALERLDHPAIVRYLGNGVTPDTGQRFLVMEWLDGIELGASLRKARLGLDACLRLGERVAEALGVAHAAGIVHRDVKPSNIFLCGGAVDQAKLLDFGIARWTDIGALTKTGARFGTPAYMSPEQVRGDAGLDARADVFSLGCVLFECLAGRPPFAAKDDMAIFGKILFQNPPLLSEEVPGMPEPVEQLIVRMLAREPDQRPGSGAEVVAEVRSLRALLGKSVLERSYGGRPRRDTLTNQEQRLVSVVVATVDARRRNAEGSVGPDTDIAGDERVPEVSGLEDTMISVKMYAAAPDRAEAAEGTGEPPDEDIDLDAELFGDVDVRSANGAGDTDVASMSASPDALGAILLAVRARLDELGARCQLLDSGLLVAVLENHGPATSGTAVDQASHAARCALTLREALPAAPVALATGRIVVGRERLMGEVIERAVALLAAGAAGSGGDGIGAEGDAVQARVEAGAPLTGVRIDDVTALLLRERFRIEGDASRGFSLLEEGPGHEAWPGRRLPFVGRRGEMATLVATLDECIEEKVARAILVTGPAGYGKSRLCEEFLARVRQRGDDLGIWVAQGDPVRAGSPLHLFATAVRRAASELDAAAPGTSRDALRRWVSHTVDAGDIDRVSDFLGELLHLTAPDEAAMQLRAARMDVQLMGDQVRRACHDLLAAETATHPLLFVIEDLQWGDRATVEVLDAALRGLVERPLLVLAVGRPDVHDLFPGLWAAHHITEIRLHHLSRKAAEQLVRAGLGEDVRDEQVEALVDRADGNPYYLEELIRRGPAGDTLPRTVAAMVDARLGGLDADARRVLRAASIFGRVFWAGGVRALLGDGLDVNGWLDVLVALELVGPAADARFARERGFHFRHDLLRDGAYETLTADDRQLGHRLAGAWLETVGEQDARVLAAHFDRGGMPERALPFYVSAAEAALGSNDLDGAMAMVERGLACGAEDAHLGALRRVQMEEQIWRGDNTEVARLGAEAMALLPRGSRGWYDVLGEVAAAWCKLGSGERLDEIVDELEADGHSGTDRTGWLVAMAKVSVLCFAFGREARAQTLLGAVEAALREARLDEPVLAGYVHFSRAFHAETVSGDPTAVLHEFEQCVACFEAVGDLRQSCLHRRNVGYAKLELGLFEAAETDLRSALASAMRLQIDFVANSARQALAMAMAYRGRLSEARALQTEAWEWFVKRQDVRMAALSRLYLTFIFALEGDLEAAERGARATLEQLPERASLRPMALASLARVLMARDCLDEAAVLADEAMALLDRLDNVELGEALVRLVQAETLAARGERDGAHAAIAQARDALLSRAARIGRADWRRSFLQNVPEHARTLELAQSWLG